MGARPATSERLQLPGPAGELQVVLEAPAPEPSAFAVVCHPHPLYGGTLDNKVVHTLARALLALGLATLRFNFRGVGRSAGSYDEGRGETDDALAIAEWGRGRWHGAPVWLAGFSFGAFVAYRAAASVRAERLITVAPPVARFAFADEAAPRCPWLLVQGDADEVVDHREVLAWAAAHAQPPEIVLLPGVTHFFHGRLHDLQESVGAWARRK